MSNQSIILDQIEIGPMQNYFYFVGDPDTKQVAVVDPAWDVDRIMQEAENRKYIITAIILTHAHPDHINALDALHQKVSVPIYASVEEKGFYQSFNPSFHPVKDNDTISISALTIRVLHTPGHTVGGICLYAENVLITGDTLFINGVGRSDLPGGSSETLLHSIHHKIMKLPDDTLIYPGHRYHVKAYDTLKNQKQTNSHMSVQH